MADFYTVHKETMNILDWIASRQVMGLGVFVCIVVVVSGCSPTITTEPPTNPPFTIVQTRFLGSLWNEAQARASIISQDGGESFTVPGGAIWAFGDTFKGSRAVDGTPHFKGGAISCAIAFLGEKARSYPPALSFFVSNNIGAISPFEFLPAERPTERYRIWPLGGIYLSGKYYLFYSLIEVFGNGPWDFRGVGSGLGRSTAALGAYERLCPKGNWRFPVEPTQVIATNGWLYFSVFRNSTGNRASPWPGYVRKKSKTPMRTNSIPAPAPHSLRGRRTRSFWSETFRDKFPWPGIRI